MRMRFAASVLALSACLPFASLAGAATLTQTMNVSISVSATCAVSVSDINFGTVAASTLSSALASTAAMGGLLTYTCASANTPGLAASQGQNYSASNRMKGSTSGGFLPYTLTLPTLPAYTGAQQTAQIKATIPAQTTLPVNDTYTDQVVLTLTY